MPQTQVIAQPPNDMQEDPLVDAIDRYLEKRTEQEQHPNQQMHRRDRERFHETHRDGAHHFEQQKQRIEKMHLAAKHIEEAGLPEMAHQIHRQAEEQADRLQEQIEHSQRHGHRPPPHPPEIHQLLHQLQHEIHELKSEVRALRAVISDSSVKPER